MGDWTRGERTGSAKPRGEQHLWDVGLQRPVMVTESEAEGRRLKR
jgi:hypothetical protein